MPMPAMALINIHITHFPWGTFLACWAVITAKSAFADLLDPHTCSLGHHGSIPDTRPELSTCPLPVDEDSAFDTGSFAPWKRRPYCVEPAQDDAPGPQFCLYTFEPFRGDHGLSVITTPALAASMVDALDDAVVPPNLRDHPSSSLAAEGQSPAYVIKDVQKRGKGLVAQRPIRKWDVVLVDYPVMIAHMDVFGAVDDDSRADLLEQAVRQLPETQQHEIMSLARSSGGEPIEDILKTNIFGVELGLEIPHSGLFTIGSRINHNCNPTVFWRYSVRTLGIEVIAMRDIEVGEEITQSYVPLGLSYKDRKEGLKNWNFACTCSLCAASKSQRAASDRHRERLLDIYHELNDGATGKGNLTESIVNELTGEMESLIHEEKLEAQQLVYYGVVARAYMRVGELVAARKYVELCEDLWVRYAGDDQDYLAGMHQLRHELTEREKKVAIG
ncbi:SET domain-containing protein [Hypoxylon cercidicola]|nr:SET domain-containing protein [Hypoxylon cercidicola]